MNREEEKKILFEHRLGLQRIFLEKFLIAIVLVIAAVAGNFLIEKYKQESTRAQFLLEKKLASIYELRRSYSDITSIYYDISEKSCQSKRIDLKKVASLKNNINSAVRIVNRESVLFGPDYQSNTGLVLNLLRGISIEPHHKLCDYRAFVSDISNHLTLEFRKELDLSDIEISTFIPIFKSKERLDKIGVTEYLRLNFQKWKNSEK